MDSLIPASLPYGVFTGQLYRYYRICSSWQTFVSTAIELAHVVIQQGCTAARLRRCFREFLFKKRKLRWLLKAVKLDRMFGQGVGSSNEPSHD